MGLKKGTTGTFKVKRGGNLGKLGRDGRETGKVIRAEPSDFQRRKAAAAKAKKKR
jgi:hypothetical protein